MRTRMSFLILLAVMIQILVFSAVLIFGGEFRGLKEYSYHALVEKTENSSIYIQNKLQEKSVIVQEYAEEINDIAAGILKRQEASVSDIQTEKELAQQIKEESAEIMSSLLRRSMADEVYFILNTDELYSEADNENSDFYFKTLQTAQENNKLEQDSLGYWNRFSKMTSDAELTMKYSLPLIAEDGTVYGVLGIGLTERTVLSNLPSGETDCYVLGYSTSDKNYDILAYSGAAYDMLLDGADTLHISIDEGKDIYRFDMITDVDLVGSIQDLVLYSPNSPYKGDPWVMICVADREVVLQPLLSLQRMLGVSVVLSLIIAVIVSVLGCGVIVRPLVSLSQRIRTKRKYNEIIRFGSSNIYEIDDITDAITQLQVNVLDFSSQVSRMISVTDVGVGTFMYDRTDDSVFVGQSLIKVLRLDLPQGEDIVMSREEFLRSIKNVVVRIQIALGLGRADGKPREDSSEVHRINLLSGGTSWIRLGFTYSPTSAIGIVQDITDTMIEKNRIEHERDHDVLTGLLTRHAYYRHVEKLFQNKSRLNITAFVMIDLDSLKYVNDTYGHAFGDDYIKTAAAALRRFESYGGIVARLSGDEFNICLPGFSSKEEAWEIIRKVRAELLQSSCLLADGTHFKVSASMGISWYPDDAKSRELLMKYADFAMYTVKHSQKGGIAEFDFNSYSRDSTKLIDLGELNRIIEEARVQYAFQSIVSVKTGEIYGYEALMRVQSNIFQSPLELLNFAKESAKLHEIERLTWTKALADYQALVNAGRVEKDAYLFVNSIANHRLEDEVIHQIEVSHPQLLDRIVMEIVESESAGEDIIAHKEEVISRWTGQIALDDYGTGYNSEYALLNLHPSIIKIDRSIISSCDQDADRRMVIENLVKMAQAKGVFVLAEGVETLGEMETVISCGVDYLQGYYLARPVFEPEPLTLELSDTIRCLAED